MVINNNMPEWFDLIAEYNHEQVMMCQDASLGVRTFIAIHNTTLGPAIGGCRIMPYANEFEAFIDTLRISRSMTLKAAAAGLNLGGGMAVMIGNPKDIKNEFTLRRFGKFVNNLGGKYVTSV